MTSTACKDRPTAEVMSRLSGDDEKYMLGESELVNELQVKLEQVSVAEWLARLTAV